MDNATTQPVEKNEWKDVPVPSTPVSVYEALHHRRMAWKWQDKAVPRQALERMLDTTVWAPNHRQTEPWRFFVIPHDSAHRQRLADFAHDATIARDGEGPKAGRMRQWVLDQPELVFAYSVPGGFEEMTRENYAATVCALHNVGLAGVAEGIAVTWETGGVAKLPGLAEAVGADPEWQLVAMASVGYSDEESHSSRTPASEFVHWSD
jgi:nitroreductase